MATSSSVVNSSEPVAAVKLSNIHSVIHSRSISAIPFQKVLDVIITITAWRRRAVIQQGGRAERRNTDPPIKIQYLP